MSTRSLPGSGAAVQVSAAVTDYLEDLTRRSHLRLGNVAGVAVSMVGAGDEPVTAGASTQLARTVDAVQYAIGTGPCLDALAGSGGAYVADLGADPRWGDYGARASARGVRCCLSVPVRAADTVGVYVDDPERVMAVVKVYGTEIDGLDVEQQRLGRSLATEVVAGIRMAQTLQLTATELDDRARAMNSRRSIDLAVGILMERAGVDADQAFALLKSYSQTRNTRLVDVVADLLEDRYGADATTPPRATDTGSGDPTHQGNIGGHSLQPAPFSPQRRRPV